MTVYRTVVPIAPSPKLVRSAGVSVVLTPTRVETRATGRHREPGSNPWRTGLRELAMWVSFGHWIPWRPAAWRFALTAH
ncbi:MAG: hypothetical protein Q4G51_12595 [Dermatophilus congolensis]|nr:hypothetical protein [Dermatophilus congolensis]